MQTGSTSLRAPLEMSDKQLQLLMRGGRSYAYLPVNNVVTSRDWVDPTMA